MNFKLSNTIYVHLLVCCLNKLQNARCNDTDNNWHFTRRRVHIYDTISLNSSYSDKCFSDKVVHKIKTHILCSVTFLSKIVPFMR